MMCSGFEFYTHSKCSMYVFVNILSTLFKQNKKSKLKAYQYFSY